MLKFCEDSQFGQINSKFPEMKIILKIFHVKKSVIFPLSNPVCKPLFLKEVTRKSHFEKCMPSESFHLMVDVACR